MNLWHLLEKLKHLVWVDDDGTVKIDEPADAYLQRLTYLGYRRFALERLQDHADYMLLLWRSIDRA